MHIDPHRQAAPRARVQGVRGDRPPSARHSRFESILALTVVLSAVTLLWVGSHSGWIRFEVAAFSESSEFLDKTVAALQRSPYDELATVKSSKETGERYAVEYSVRRKKHEVLEIQAALIDRRHGATLDRLVTWRGRDRKN